MFSVVLGGGNMIPSLDPQTPADPKRLRYPQSPFFFVPANEERNIRRVRIEAWIELGLLQGSSSRSQSLCSRVFVTPFEPFKMGTYPPYVTAS